MIVGNAAGTGKVVSVKREFWRNECVHDVMLLGIMKDSNIC